MTETAPGATTAHFDRRACGCIGVPLPGVTLKLAPPATSYEIRAATGPNVTPGYHRDPEATAAAFDDEGFFRTGDAARLVDPGDPAQGLMFDGRLGEDFKLATGTWVTVGRLRTALVSAAGVLRDAVIAGHDGDYVAALAWVDPAEARRVCGADEDLAARRPQAARPPRARARRPSTTGQGRRVASSDSSCSRRPRAWTRGDHRQGLRQPAAGAGPARPGRRAAARGAARRIRHHGDGTVPPVSSARLTSSGHGVASRVVRSMRQTVIDAVAATPSAAPMTTA